MRVDVLATAVGTEAVAELRFGALLDVALERAPVLGVVPDPLAVGADRQQALELLQLAPQTEDALGDRQPGAQLVGVHRLGDEIVRPGLHPGEVLLLATLAGAEAG